MSLATTTHNLRKRAAVFLLLAFACGQFVEFSHQNEHSILDAAEQCATCVQFDKFGSVAGLPATNASAEFFVETLPEPHQQLVAQPLHSRPSARAPPLS